MANLIVLVISSLLIDCSLMTLNYFLLVIINIDIDHEVQMDFNANVFLSAKFIFYSFYFILSNIFSF